MISYTFLRYEMKYLLTPAQYEAVRRETDRRLSPDAFGETTIQSLYYDTRDDRLVRDSIQKPTYKEKLRLRCYGQNTDNRNVYLEMKRKSEDVVYKRRIACKEAEAEQVLKGRVQDSQIARELQYFLYFYGELKPKILLLYDRSAFFDPESDLRVTFDRNIRYRTERLRFDCPTEGENLLNVPSVLMELKTGTAVPLWLCKILSGENIRKTSFSKYGAAYQREYRKQFNLGSEDVCLNPYFVTEASLRQASLLS